MEESLSVRGEKLEEGPQKGIIQLRWMKVAVIMYQMIWVLPQRMKE